MSQVPLPSHVHYELLLQVLERQTLYAIEPGSLQYEQAQGLIMTLRKALSQQKNFEDTCKRQGTEIDYRWSIDHAELPENVAQPVSE